MSCSDEDATLTVSEAEDVALAYCIGSSVSIFCCSLVILMFYMFPKLRKHPSEMLIYRTVCDASVGLVFIVSYAVNATSTCTTACKW